MLTRFHKILLGLLAVQIVLAIVMLSRGDGSAAKKAEPLLPGFDAAKVTKIVVYASGSDKPAVELAKQGSGWVIASAFGYPADDSKVSAVLSPIATMAAALPIATQASRFKQLKVDDADFDKKLVLTVDGKDTTAFVGAPAGSRRNAVRLGGDSRVFAVAGPSAYAIGDRPRDWVDLKYVDVARDDLTKVTIQRDATTVVLTRDGDKWTPSIGGAPVALGSGETVDTAAIDRATGDLSTLDLSAPADPKRDASHPLATITIERKAPPPAPDAAAGSGSGSGSSAAPPAPIVLDIVADGETYWVHDRAKPTAIAIDKSRLDAVVQLDRDKLVKKPEPAAPGKGSATANKLPAMPMAPHGMAPGSP